MRVPLTPRALRVLSAWCAYYEPVAAGTTLEDLIEGALDEAVVAAARRAQEVER